MAAPSLPTKGSRKLAGPTDNFTMRPPLAPTKSQVNKAGKLIRKGLLREESVAWDDLVRAMGVLERHRADHQYPLAKATMGLRSVVKTEGCIVEVSQRLKRTPTILDKIVREPTMSLANMQDVAGCRAVLEDIDERRRVEKRLRKNRPPIQVYDYVETPRSSGYRGGHVIVQYDQRKVEVQLRT